MKKFKKIFAVLLTLAMVLGMSMTSFAAGEPKITINNIPEDATVTYQQIAVANPSDPIGWSLAAGVTLQNGVTLEQLVNVQNKGNSNAENGIIGDAVVDKAIKGMNLSQTLASGNEITNVTPGLYAINVVKDGWTFNPMLAYVAWNETNTSAVANTEVSVKGAPDQINKAITAVQGANHTSVSEGDVVPFTITAQYPYLSNNLTNRTFVITDTISGGTMAKEGNDVTQPVVKIGEAAATADDVTVVATENGFTATFKYNPVKAGQNVTITYSVVVGAGSAALSNNVSSSFSSTEGGDTTTESRVISPKVNVVVGKVNEKQEALAGATFDLYVETTEGATHAIVDGKIAPVSENATLKKVTSGDTAKVGNNASVTFDGLDADKKYYVVESKAPNGYALNDTPYELTGAKIQTGTPTVKWFNDKNEEVEEGTAGAKKVMVTENTVESNFTVNGGAAIVNTTLSSLPSTGGIGTTIFTIGGCAIMIIAAALFFASRRKAAK